jgi:hypothetical protein
MFVNPFISENIIPIFFLILSFVFFNYLYNSEKFRSILRPDGKKHYGETSATSNLIKTIQCTIAVIGLIYYYITDIRYGNYPNVAMKSLTMNLLAVETLSLIKAKKYYLRKDIAYHHYGVIFFSILALGVDFNKNKPAQMLIIMLFTVSLCIPYMIYNTLKAYYNLEWLRSWAIMSYIIPFPIFVIYSIFQWRFYSSEIWKWFAIYWVPITPMLYTNYVSIKFILKRQESFTQKHGKKEY